MVQSMRILSITKLAGYSISPFILPTILMPQPWRQNNNSVNSSGCSTIAYIDVIVNYHTVSHSFTSTLYDFDYFHSPVVSYSSRHPSTVLMSSMFIVRLCSASRYTSWLNYAVYFCFAHGIVARRRFKCTSNTKFPPSGGRHQQVVLSGLSF